MAPFPDISRHLKEKEGFCHPNWEAIGRQIEKSVTESDWNAAWEAAARQWIGRLCAKLGDGYQFHETANFMIVSEAPNRVMTDAYNFFEKALTQILSALSGVALEVEIQPLVQKVMRKRRVWDGVYRRRNALVLDLLERFGGLPLDGLRRTRTIWGEVLPTDRDGMVRNEAQLVASGIHSRRQSMAALGDSDPERTWQEIIDETQVYRQIPLQL